MFNLKSTRTMAEENKDLLDQAKEILSGKMGEAGGLVDQAKEFIAGKAGELLGNADELKEKVVELGKSIAPDSLDDKVEGMVDQAMDFLKDTFGKKEEK